MIIFISAIFLFIIDRITKIWALGIFEKITISPFLSFSSIRNYGISFGLFSASPELIFWLTFIICIILVIYSIFLKEKSFPFKIGIGILIGGAISNLLDRIIYGAVIDFISIGIKNLRWPTFNLADVGIVIGSLLIVFMPKQNSHKFPNFC